MRRTTITSRRRWGAFALGAGLVVGLLPFSAAAAANSVTVYYQPPAAWGGAVNIHYGVDGQAWTAVPGVPMGTACTGWRRSTIDLGAAAGLQVVFTNGGGVWDNNNGANYRLGTGTVTVAAGKVGTGDPCAGSTPSPGPSGSATPSPSPAGNTAEVWYHLTARGWTAANIHYRPTGGTWTTAPGVAMEVRCAGWARRVVDLGSATGLTAAFNDTAGTWDNNNSADYPIGTGRSTVDAGRVTPNAADPCAPATPDRTPPSIPAGLTATADGLAVTLSWTAATDDRGVTGYELTRTGGAGSTTVTSTTPRYVAYDLLPGTAYTWTVRAVDAAGNRSAASLPASATTGSAPAGGAPLGGDPREDSIYFVMTARFADGDTGNDRGGSQHVASGNAANDDPMFRGDFKGLVDKLDYIKGLGFSAIWITPVVLNRSDYDYHGYHGWDFYRVDPRLESPGASYQNLIDAAHAKGIKIFQDVVYNHTSRWGAKGLFTPTVYGVRDEQWKWYYDQPQAGREYDPLVEATGTDPALTPAQNAKAKGRPYNGDLWSSAPPTGNQCLNWGTPTGGRSAEGFTLYNCQWPTPTGKLFPADLYHQCWIGNWEGEDARSCWLHEDLADLNTENATVQQYLINAYNRYIDMGVDGFRIDTAVHIPRVTWNRRFLPAIRQHAVSRFGAKGRDFYVFGEVAAFVNDKWNRGSVNHSAQFYTWSERKEYSPDDVKAAIEQYDYEQLLGPSGQPTTDNAFLRGNDYHAPDHSTFSGMNVIDMRMHMNFGDATNAFLNGRDSDDSYNDATYNVVYVDSHDYGPNKSSTRYAGGTDAWAENMSLMWTFRGIPTLYYGSEIEFQKGARIDCGPTCPLATTGRAYYGDHLAGSVTATDFGVVGSAGGAVATTLSQPLVKHVQRLNRIRRAVPALQKGQYSTEGISGNTLAYKRRYTAGTVDSFALVTVSGGATFTGIPNGRYVDVVTGTVQTVGNGTLTAPVSGKGNLRVYVLDLPGNPAPGKIGTDGPYLR
ncbi:carbohydrate binding domain-containing protein [Micromonospora auratinigra]|uniref:Glycosidase n=1 Tax=Micromonospora auratinigra TaxID=261654 RepID=A0A1A8ZN22_9ACTN|nr:carbohydrate binding domain-containing protein [Micromonospora auratinigra]SBT45215.1 Glycosidase [Micromonospora auratinigra]